MMKTNRRRKEEQYASPAGQNSLLALYDACIANAEDLLEEAQLLFEAIRFARSFALAFTAYEEIGKSQIVADAYYDLVANSELIEAFKRHDLKIAYVRRVVRLERTSHGEFPQATIVYDRLEARPLFDARIRSLYVDFGVSYAPCSPGDAVGADMAERMIQLVKTELGAISWAEELNGRIGSKGLFK